jgi:hypothetical protein
MAKQFTFEQPGRDGGAIELDEWPILARTEAVNSARDELFARAGLAQQEDRRISPGHGFDHLEHTPKDGTSSNDAIEAGLQIHWPVEQVDMRGGLEICYWPRVLQRIGETIQAHCFAPFCPVCPYNCSLQLPLHLLVFSHDPFTNVGRAVLQIDPIRFTSGKELESVAVYECYVFQIQGDLTASGFQLEEPAQFFDILRLDSTGESEDDLSIRFPLDP